MKWVTKYLDDVFHKRMIITHRKDLCLGDYLTDDRGKNGTSEFTATSMELLQGRTNFCLVNKNLSADMRPMVYYEDESTSMILDY